MFTLDNETASVSFDEKGGLVSLLSRAGGKEFLAPGVSAASPFAVWSEFIAPYGKKPTEPSEIASRVFSPDSPFAVFEGAERAGNALTLRYRDGSLVAVLKSALEGCSLSMTLTLSNEGNEPLSILPVFPCLSALNLSEDTAKMLIMNQAGFVGPMWVHRGGFYGNAWVHSAQFGCMFEKSDCLGFMIEDPAFGCKDISYQKPAFEVRHAPGLELNPGQMFELPRASLLIYSGDWRRTALAYGEWFIRTAKPDPLPEKVRNLSSYTGAWAVKREKGQKDDGPLILQMDSFDDLPDSYRHDPYMAKEYAFYCELSSRLLQGVPSVCGGDSRRHTDGWNEVRRDLGGAEAMRRGIKALHGMGRMLTLYIEGYITPQESDLYVKIPEAVNWAYKNPDGTVKGEYKNGWYHMCPGSHWQDHLAEMAARLVRETDCDGIRLDSLGAYFKPCWNETHRHESPFDYNKWMIALLNKVADAVKAVKPDAILSTEYPVDYYSVRFNHALFQPFDQQVWHTLNDPSPLRVALPHYRINAWYGGGVAQAMELLPNGTSNDERWFETREAIAPMFLGENTIMPDPELSRAEARCRRLQTDKGDLLLLTRPDWPENPSITIREYVTTSDLPVIADGAETTVSLPLDYKPAEAFVYDVADHTLKQLDFDYNGGRLSFVTRSGFTAVVLRRRKGAAPVIVDSQKEITAGETAVLTFTTPLSIEPVAATLCVEGLMGAENIPVTVPGTIAVRFPKDIFPGRYVARLSGGGFDGAIRIIKVNKSS